MKKVIVTNKKLMECVSVMQYLMNQDVSYKTALKLDRNANIINKYLEIFNKQNKELIESYYKTDEKGKMISDENGKFILRDDKDVNEFISNKQELDSFENSLEIYEIDPEELEGVKIKPSQVESLDFMISLGDDYS